MIHVVINEKIIPLSITLDLDYSGTSSYDQRVKTRFDHISKQLDMDPTYEGWDYVEHIDYNNPSEITLFRDYYISTKGRLLSVRNDKQVLLFGSLRKDGYINLKFSNEGRNYLLHRLVGSTFIPIPETLERINITINHKKGNKKDNRFSQLEWATLEGNAVHAVESNLGGYNRINYVNSIFLAEYVLDDEYEGTKFIIKGTKNLKELGFSLRILDKSIGAPKRITLGCKWSIIHSNESYSQPTGFILDKLLNDLTYLKYSITPILGTHPIIGSFALYGTKEIIQAGFSPGAVTQCSLGASKYNTHKGCVFRKVSRKEANQFQRGLTEKQKKIISD